MVIKNKNSGDTSSTCVYMAHNVRTKIFILGILNIRNLQHNLKIEPEAKKKKASLGKQYCWMENIFASLMLSFNSLVRNKEGADTFRNRNSFCFPPPPVRCVGEKQVHGDACNLLELHAYYGVEREVSKRSVLVTYCCIKNYSKTY